MSSSEESHPESIGIIWCNLLRLPFNGNVRDKDIISCLVLSLSHSLSGKFVGESAQLGQNEETNQTHRKVTMNSVGKYFSRSLYMHNTPRSYFSRRQKKYSSVQAAVLDPEGFMGV